MIYVITWLWRPHRNYRTQYVPLHVDLMRQHVAEHCSLEHEFICVTDRASTEFGPGIRLVKLWQDCASLPPAFPKGPSCYRRLRIFAPEAHELLGVPAGSTIVSLDLDSVLLGEMAPLWDREDDFIGWRASDRAPTCGSMFLHKLGTQARVWKEFNFSLAMREAKRTGYVGTDQAWMARMLAKAHGSWGVADGVYSFKQHCIGGLPKDARIVFFHGKPDPWDEDVRRDHPWIVEHYPVPGVPVVEESAMAEKVVA